MALYFFKLLGGFGDRSEADIEIPFDVTVKEVKDLIRKEFRILPTLQLDLMVKGKKLLDDQKWGMTDAKPNSSSAILIIGHRND